VRRYGVRVPVVEVDGVEVAELEVAPGTVRRVRARGTTWSWATRERGVAFRASKSRRGRTVCDV
jgi:hypothetical protein